MQQLTSSSPVLIVSALSFALHPHPSYLQGQLGNGRTGEHIAKANTVAFEKADEPMAVGGELSGKKITMVASGTAHSCALDEDGCVPVLPRSTLRLTLRDD